jgi:phage replication-related protein YjqB (UPF0714/DUF867 family)
MTTYDASIRNANKSTQQDLIKQKEHCSADPEKLATVGRALGHQVRIKRNDSEYGLYTVSEVRQESRDNIVRMGEGGRERLGTDKEFAGTLDSQVPHPTFTDEQKARDYDEFIEQLEDNGRHTGLIAIAPHGGDIEQYTDLQAEHVASRLAAKGVSSWRCKGYKQGGAFEAWHITSTDINEACFPGLNSVISRGFNHAVAFHGYTPEPGQPDILVGGTSPLREEIVMAIKDAVAGSDITVELLDPIRDKGFNGDSLLNIVNRLTANRAGGVQIEQSLRARSGQGQDIADAVANVYNLKLPQGPGTIEPKTPRDAILEQYVVLKATLVGPIGKIDLSNEQITLDDGSKTTVIVNNPDGSTTINFPTNPPNFFAPFPPIVEWDLPDPQPPIPVTLEGTKQPCRSERCSINVNSQGVGRSLLGPYEQTP